MRPAALRLSRALVLLAALLVAATACGEATATRPCWKQVQDDWTNNKLGEHTYAASCYDQAIKHLPPDLRYYSDAPEEIQAAKQRAVNEKIRTLANAGGSNGSGENGTGGGTGGGGGGDDGGSDIAAGPVNEILNAGSSTADGMPIPLLILGGVALALVAAGAIGVMSRQLQTRRTPPSE